MINPSTHTLVLLVVLLATSWVAADQPPAKPPALKPSDAQLLDELPPPKRPAAAKPNAPEADDSPPAKPAAKPNVEDAPKASLTTPADDEGEDIGAESAGARLERIGRQMRIVEGRLVKGDTSNPTQALQDRIVGELDGFLRELQQRSSNREKKPSAGTAADKTGGGQLKPSDRPAEDSSERPNGSKTGQGEEAARQQLIKQVWGQLPAEVRQQLLTALPEQFLPAYESLIEEYYRRLAERKSP